MAVNHLVWWDDEVISSILIVGFTFCFGVVVSFLSGGWGLAYTVPTLLYQGGRYLW